MHQDRTLALLDYLRIIGRQWKLVTTVTVVVTLAGLTVLLFRQPREYTAQTRLMYVESTPVLGANALSAAEGFSAAITAGPFSLGGGANQAKFEKVKGLVGSRAIQDPLIEEFGLRAWFKAETADDAYTALSNATQVESRGSSSTVEIVVALKGTPQGPQLLGRGPEPAKDRQAREMAAAVANRYTELVETWFRENQFGEEQTRKGILETSLSEHETMLDEAQDALAAFQTAHSAMAPDTEAQELVASLADVEAQMADARARAQAAAAQATDLANKLESMDPERESGRTEAREATVDDIQARLSAAVQRLAAERGKGKKDTHPDVAALEREIDDLESQLDAALADPMYAAGRTTAPDPTYDALKLEMNRAQADAAEARARVGELGGRAGELEGRLGSLPRVSQEWSRLAADVARERAIVEKLTTDLEVARVEAKKEAKVFEVIDPAVAPERKSAPSLTRGAVLAFAVGLVLGVYLALQVGLSGRASQDAASASPKGAGPSAAGSATP